MEHDELKGRPLTDLALADKAKEDIQHRKYHGGARDDVHYGSTRTLTGARFNAMLSSKIATSPLVPANRGGLI